jgi:hypothetical protein
MGMQPVAVTGAGQAPAALLTAYYGRGLRCCPEPPAAGRREHGPLAAAAAAALLAAADPV